MWQVIKGLFLDVAGDKRSFFRCAGLTKGLFLDVAGD
jgi:hypothetical protein